MLTKEQYKALRRYRDADVAVGENGLSEVDMFLCEQGYIKSAEMKMDAYLGVFQLSTVSYCITELGRTALKEYEKVRRERWFQVFLVALGAALAFIAERIASHLG